MLFYKIVRSVSEAAIIVETMNFPNQYAYVGQKLVWMGISILELFNNSKGMLHNLKA